MGEMEVPDDALWGASTQRAVLNFPISGHRLPPAFLRGLGLVKGAAARANEELGRLPPEKSRLIQQVAREVAEGQLNGQFPVDVFQTGSGTSTNTNANEVIAHRAAQLPGGRALHPNDDVNLGQSSNDVIPTALHVSVALALHTALAPALAGLGTALDRKAAAFAEIGKIGRTHLMDATPLTLGQEFSGYAAQVRKAGERVRKRAIEVLGELAIGGTAVGTGLNTPPEFGGPGLPDSPAPETGLGISRSAQSFRGAGSARRLRGSGRDPGRHRGGARTKIANDIRLLASGPRAGLGELRLPATQPGSSIMPEPRNPPPRRPGMCPHAQRQLRPACSAAQRKRSAWQAPESASRNTPCVILCTPAVSRCEFAHWPQCIRDVSRSR